MPSSFSFDYPTFFDEFGPRPRQTTYHRQRNRGVPLQNLFTDPLFKEQWYLVSGPFDFTFLKPRAKRTLDVTRLCHFWDACLLDTIPFRSVPFRFVPFRSVSFRSVPFRSKSTVQSPFPVYPILVSIEFFIDSVLSTMRCNNNGKKKKEKRER